MCLSWNLYYETLTELESVKIATTTNRSNVSGLKEKKQCGKNKVSVGYPMKSINFGMVIRQFSKSRTPVPSVHNERYPELYAQLKILIKEIDPDFIWNTITVNHNFECLPHYDKSNKSPSIILTLGDFTGGEFVVEGCPFDINWRPLVMNGSVCKHWTAPFEGERYSLIFYNV